MKTPEPSTPARTDALEIAHECFLVCSPSNVSLLFAELSKEEICQLYEVIKCAALIEPKLRERDQRITALTEERDALQSTITACEGEVAKVYWHITDNKFSKMNTRAEVIIDEYEEKLAAAREDGERLRVIRELMGYVQDGSHSTVTIFQDDATNDFFLKNEQRSYHANSFNGAIDAARQSHNEEGKG